MTSWAFLVEFSTSDSSILQRIVNGLHGFFIAIQTQFGKTLHNNSSAILLNFHLAFALLQEINKFLFIYLKERHGNIHSLAKISKNMSNRSRNKSFILASGSKNCMRFSWTCLTIGKYCSVVTLGQSFKYWFCNSLEY